MPQSSDNEDNTCRMLVVRDPAAPSKPEGFFDLPPELREMGYNFYFSDKSKPILNTTPYLPQPAILRTSKKLRNEAMDSYLRQTIFETTSLSRLESLLNGLHPTALMRIKEIRLQEFGCLDRPMDTMQILKEVRDMSRNSMLNMDAVMMPFSSIAGETTNDGVVWVNLRQVREKFGETRLGRKEKRRVGV